MLARELETHLEDRPSPGNAEYLKAVCINIFIETDFLERIFLESSNATKRKVRFPYV
jgi:hypothetical protein